MSMNYTVEALEDAPMLALLCPIEGLPWERRGGVWDLFEVCGGDIADERVERYTDDMRVHWLPLCPMMDDEVAEKLAKDDLDAAVYALHDGYYLIKLPDTPKSKAYRFYVVSQIGDWSTPKPRLPKSSSCPIN
jgi:hypothetical protein